MNRRPTFALGLLPLLVASAGCPARPQTPKPTPIPPTVVGPAFSPPGGGRPFSRFIANRDFMHSYLYNGDDLFPKAVNLCARGRNALLDLDRGPGSSFDLGLFGPAWEAHIYAVAVDRDPRRPRHQKGRTHFVYSWPVVSTSQSRMLRLAYDVAVAAPRADLDEASFWRLHATTLSRLRWSSYLALRAPRLAKIAQHRARATPAQGLALRRSAGDWAERLVIALMERLSHSVRVLGRNAPPLSLLSSPRFEQLSTALYARRPGATADLTRFLQQLEAAARKAGVLHDARRYRRFHERALLADLGRGWRHGRVSADQLRAILAHLNGLRQRRITRLEKLRPVVLRELARLEYILHGHRYASLPAAQKHHGARTLEADRRSYVRLAAEVKRIRKRLTTLARTSLTAAVRARLHASLKTGEPSLAVGSFYFETEHLLETTSGFTHVGLLKRLRDPKTKNIYLWVFDRVLGFHYAYPMSKLTNSIPVQAIALSARVAQKRRSYRWLALQVPRVFRLGRGLISTQVTLVNLFAHVRELLRNCDALATAPGFYYAGISWLINHPRNKGTLRDIWVSRTHTGYAYRTLDPDLLQRLRGRVLYVPVFQIPGGQWTRSCPRRIPSTSAKKTGRI